MGKKFVLMSEPTHQCENNAAKFEQNYTQKMFIGFVMTY